MSTFWGTVPCGVVFFIIMPNEVILRFEDVTFEYLDKKLFIKVLKFGIVNA